MEKIYRIVNNYWRFYLLLENKFIETLRYVEFADDNYNTYSLEFVSLLREIGSEIDIIMKEICMPKKADNINGYAKIILEENEQIMQQEVQGKGVSIKPFESWRVDNEIKPLKWWQAYNKIKHGRVANFTTANLKNVFYALGALFILNNYLLKKTTQAPFGISYYDKESDFFILKEEETVMSSLRKAQNPTA